MAPELLSNTAAWPQGYVIEAAIEHAIGSLDSLFAAARAWVPIGPAYHVRYAKKLPPDPEHQRIFDALVREEAARFAPFLQLLENGEWVARIRPWADVNAPFRLLQAEEAFQLRLIVHRSGNSLELQGPDRKRLFGLFWPKHAAPSDEVRVAVTKWPSRQAMVAKQSEAPLQTAAIRSNKDWYERAIKNIPPDDSEWGWKKRYAQKLAGRMKVDVKGNKNIKPRAWETIYSRLSEIGWPETHD